MIAREFFISGRVQGVGFRAHTQRQAIQLGLRGSAINLDDGRVRVQAFGSETALRTLEAWLRRGPSFARVDAISKRDLDLPAPNDFTVG